MSDCAVLRPVTRADLAVLDRFLLEPETTGPFEWLGWIDPGQWRRQWARDGMLGPDGGKLMVVVDAEAVGFVGWRRVAVDGGSSCWNISIALFPEARGRGHGSVAQRLLVDHLFAHTELHRIEADTDVANVAEQRALENAGFTREQVFPGQIVGVDGRSDSVLYGIHRDQWPEPDR